MIRKRHIILCVILVVALTLTFSVSQAQIWNHVETWNFSLNSKGWNTVGSWSFTLNSISSWNSVKSWSFICQTETLSWNHADVETTIVSTYPDWLPIAATALVVAFTFAMLMTIIYVKKKSQKERRR